jgi:2-keto-4-pentenoate hydratase/2-oxohepta-3-ene-1,7-dioic acid hydratase in catechol pathway
MLKKGGLNIKQDEWKNGDYIGAYYLLLDYSDVPALKSAMEKGHPWLLAKG